MEEKLIEFESRVQHDVKVEIDLQDNLCFMKSELRHRDEVILHLNNEMEVNNSKIEQMVVDYKGFDRQRHDMAEKLKGT